MKKSMYAFLLVCLACTSSPQQNTPPAEKQDCAKCGMYVDDHKNWVATALHSQTKQEVIFCTPSCLLVSLLEKKDVYTNPYFTSYYTLEKVKGQEAFLVMQSDVISPMGKDFVPFASEEEAKEFMQEHRGKKIMRWQEIDFQALQEAKK